MAKNNYAQNVAFGANPMNNFGGNFEKKLSSQLDPMSLTGWNKSGFDPYGGMPSNYPTYVGMAPEDLALYLKGGDENKALDKYFGESLRTDLAPSTRIQLEQNRLGANSGREQARKMAGGMAANASSNLAMKGGIGAGAQERIQKQATNSALDFSNQSDNAAAQGRVGILQGDEASRVGNLNNAATMMQGKKKQDYDMQQNDLNRQIAERKRQDDYNMQLYNTQMQTWAAGKQAEATANSGKK